MIYDKGELATIPIDSCKAKLETAYLPPSHKILMERLEERFGHFKSMGITNLKELISLLKKKDNVDVLAKLDCFKDDYLSILYRQLNEMNGKMNYFKGHIGLNDVRIFVQAAGEVPVEVEF